MNKELAPALDEIAAVLKKHDVMGFIILSNATHTDFRMEVETSWTCAKIENNAQGETGIRVRSKRAEYASAEAQKEAIAHTIGSFVTTSDVLRVLQDQLQRMLVVLAKHVEFFGSSTRED